MAKITAPHFSNEEAAREYLESIRWAAGVTCPHCSTVGTAYTTKKTGVYRCAEKGCRKDFSVTVGTIYERSHIPLHKWLLASYLLCSSKKGISSLQLQRMLGVTYKTAWFMTHRIREAMKPGNLPPLGGKDKVVESDETFIGNIKGNNLRRASYHHKHKVMSLVERGGTVRSFHVEDLYVHTLKAVLLANVKTDTTLMTDDFGAYRPIGREFAKHEAINHSKDEFVRGRTHTNTIEGYFSIFTRGMKGIYQHCSERHLHRYLAEFDFRYSHREALGVDDMARFMVAVQGIEGKRLMYRGASGVVLAQ